MGEGYSQEFEVTFSVTRALCSVPVPLEDPSADDLAIIAASLEECVRMLMIWKKAMEEKGLRVNAGKTMIMV